MHLRLVRHATLLVEYAGLRLLLDPMLDPAGARPAIANTANDRRNPLVELPEPAASLLAGVDAVLVTHLHADHYDDAARRQLPHDVALLCQPPDASTLAGDGFADVRPVDDELHVGPVAVARTGGEHGHGEVARALAPVSGFVLRGDGEPALYVAGDTVWCGAVEQALERHRPDVVVLNAGGARFVDSEPITMDAAEVGHVCRAAPGARVVAVHLEAINHCLETRAMLAERLAAGGLAGRVAIPADGETLDLGG